MTDKQLISAYQSGNTSAMGTLYNRYKEQLFWFIYRYIRDEDNAEDLVQDTFLHAMKSEYKPLVKVSTWLHMIAKCRVFKKSRKENAQKRSGIELSKDEDEPDFHLVDQSLTPDNQTDVNMKMERVKEKATHINADYAQAVFLYDYQGYHYKEIADMMGVEIGTVKSRIYRGRKLLQ